MNILFALYHDFSTASAIHVHNFATSLVASGYGAAVAVPHNKASVHEFFTSEPRYLFGNYEDILDQSTAFSPDIIHAWTPRENIRIFCSQLKEKFPKVKVIVHLEDNEEVITETFSGMSMTQLGRISEERLDYVLPRHISHPIRYRKFLESAEGLTVIIDELLDFSTDDKPYHRLWPIIDLERFSPDIDGTSIRESYNVHDHEMLICYCGSVHEVNCREVKSLYLAVALANRRGIPVKLIRSGWDVVDFLGDLKQTVAPYVIELGHVDMDMIPLLMAASDMLIQPGRNDAFNRYRLPSKIPEFLAMGKPVLMPRVNIGRLVEEEEVALIKECVDVETIVNSILYLKGEPALSKRLGEKARNYATKHFSQAHVIEGLSTYYQNVLAG